MQDTELVAEEVETKWGRKKRGREEEDDEDEEAKEDLSEQVAKRLKEEVIDTEFNTEFDDIPSRKARRGRGGRQRDEIVREDGKREREAEVDESVPSSKRRRGNTKGKIKSTAHNIFILECNP